MLVLPNGYPGLMQMYLFGPPYGRYDGAMDASMVYHEYAHGLSERLVTDAQGFGALIGAQPGAIAEGTSDFYAMDYLVADQPGLVPDGGAQGEVRVGKWLQVNTGTTGLNAIRTEGLDCAVQPQDDERVPRRLRADDAGWLPLQRLRPDRERPRAARRRRDLGQTLWSIRSALVAAHGQQEGLSRARAYITGGLRLAPEDPTFLDMRNAIVQAAWTQHGSDDWRRSGTCSPRAAWAGGPRPRARTTRRRSRTSTRPRTRRATRRAAAR